MIFRWSLWGDYAVSNIELLRYSIETFYHQFNKEHRYIVYTDHVDSLRQDLPYYVEVNSFGEGVYCNNYKPTWKKWCPKTRIDIKEDEIFVDSDVFLLDYPTELIDMLNNPSFKFGIMDEYIGKPFQHGSMHKFASEFTPYLNAGFFVQKKGFSIEEELKENFDKWEREISESDHTHHDEQGALMLALTPYYKKSELYVFPKDKYKIISKTSNPDLQNLEGTILFHATYADHPAFYRFKNYIDNLLNL